MSDEGFHEFQLNGKQLAFLFMAATVVAVVIFLCGVMVGRGVPIRAGSAVDAPEQASLDPTAALQVPRAEQAVAGTGPVTAQETLSYPTLLEDPNPPEETLKPVVELADAPAAVAAPRPTAISPPPTAAPAAVAKPAPVAPRPAVSQPVAAAAPVTATADATPAEPPGTGFVVQVAAVRQLTAANAIARRLTTKGYPTFITTAGVNFRVRVGKYSDRREAEAVAGRLEKEERFKPWITR